ncbi:MAG TPA: ABC transporter ATP-binding protein [Candidatus Saccharimonadia bacterium]
MEERVAISVKNIRKNFKLPHERYTSLKQSAMHLFTRKGFTRFEALKDVSFEVMEGEFFGIVGRNGSGKSTLLKLLGGIYQPTSGRIAIHGSLSPFIELGVGFNPELSGRDNVFLNGAILGLSRKQIEEKYDDIVAFSELHEFMDQKLKNYSSGMQVRLAFSIAIQARSDILLIDEVLAVGDANFQQKCYNFFREMKREKRTIVFVSHDMNAIKDFCDRALLIQDGVVAAVGAPDRIINKYNRLNIVERKELESVEYAMDTANRWGSGDLVVKDVVTKLKGRPRKSFEPGEDITIEIKATVKRKVDQPIFGLIIKSPQGLRVMVTNTRLMGLKTKAYSRGETVTFSCSVKNIFSNGRYTISPGLADTDGNVFYDWIEDAAWFEVHNSDSNDGVVLPDHTLKVFVES